MAHITWTITNGKRIPHVHGRNSGHFPSRVQVAARKGRATGFVPVERKRVCVLNEVEAEQLEHHGVSYPCLSASRRHAHYTRKAVQLLIKKGEARWVGGTENVMTFVRARTWQPKDSGGMTVNQMVPGGACY